jgi:hypothetical protein
MKAVLRNVFSMHGYSRLFGEQWLVVQERICFLRICTRSQPAPIKQQRDPVGDARRYLPYSKERDVGLWEITRPIRHRNYQHQDDFLDWTLLD